MEKGISEITAICASVSTSIKWAHDKTGLPGGSLGKESTCNQEAQIQSLGQEDPLEKGMATHSSIPAWEIPWTEEPGGLQSMELQEADTTE